MTKEDLEKVKDLQQEYLFLYPKWRYGQAFFNALYELFPNIADSIRGSNIDPFYRDDNVEKCIKYLEDRNEQRD